MVSAVLELGPTHWGLAWIALPFLVAQCVLARLAYPALLVRSVVALALFVLSIALGGVVAWSGDAAWATALHVGAAAAAFGASLLVVVVAFRGRAAPLGAARDYLTLTKPRIMSLLLAHRRGRDVRRRAGSAARAISSSSRWSGSGSRAAARRR